MTTSLCTADEIMTGKTFKWHVHSILKFLKTKISVDLIRKCTWKSRCPEKGTIKYSWEKESN